MRTKHSKIFFVLLGLIITASLITPSCKSRKHSPEQKADWITDKIVDELDMTEEQEMKVNKIKDEIVARGKANKKKYDGMLDEFITIIKSEKADRAQLMEMMERKHKIAAENHDFHADKMVEFHSILSKEQKEKLADLMKKFGKKHHDK